MVIFIIILVLINIASFVNYKYDDGFKELFGDGTLGWRVEILFLLFGNIGALLALILTQDKSVEKSYKIVIPVIFVIETGTVLYLLLFEMGILK